MRLILLSLVAIAVLTVSIGTVYGVTEEEKIAKTDIQIQNIEKQIAELEDEKDGDDDAKIDKQITKLQKKIKQLEEKQGRVLLKQLDTHIQWVKGQFDTYDNKHLELTNTINDLKSKVESLESKVESLESKVESLESKSKPVEKEIQPIKQPVLSTSNGNLGEVQWLEVSYPASGTGVVRVIDPDMNLNPESVDNFDVNVWSDSDAGGISLTVTETNEATGIFEGTVFFTTTEDSRDHRLRVADGDTVTAEYEDTSLPNTYGIGDEQDVIATTLIHPSIPNTNNHLKWNPTINGISVNDSEHQVTVRQTQSIWIAAELGDDALDGVLSLFGPPNGDMLHIAQLNPYDGRINWQIAIRDILGNGLPGEYTVTIHHMEEKIEFKFNVVHG